MNSHIGIHRNRMDPQSATKYNNRRNESIMATNIKATNASYLTSNSQNPAYNQSVADTSINQSLVDQSTQKAAEVEQVNGLHAELMEMKKQLSLVLSSNNNINLPSSGTVQMVTDTTTTSVNPESHHDASLRGISMLPVSTDISFATTNVSEAPSTTNYHPAVPATIRVNNGPDVDSSVVTALSASQVENLFHSPVRNTIATGTGANASHQSQQPSVQAGYHHTQQLPTHQAVDNSALSVGMLQSRDMKKYSTNTSSSRQNDSFT